MATANADNGNPATAPHQPPKAFQGAGISPSDSPFMPPSVGRTSDVVEASGTAGDVVPANTNVAVSRQPPRSWETSNINGYGGMNYNSGYGSGMYGRPYGGLSNYGYRGMNGGGGMYGGGMYGGGMYGGSGLYGGTGMYGGGMYGGYGGMGGMGGPFNPNPNNPSGDPAQPPGFWVSLLRVMEGVVNFFSKISMLVDMNTQALNGFMYAMLQLLNSSGHLYGELALFVFRLLGIKRRPRRQPEIAGLPGAQDQRQKLIEGPKANSGLFDNIWGDDTGKAT